MHVARLSLTDYRNYARAELELGPGATVLVGRNGQGKTNLVESIGYLSTLGSHRVSGDQALIRAGADAAIVRALLTHGDRELLVELQLNRHGRQSRPAQPLAGEDARAAALRAQRAVRARRPRDRAGRALGSSPPARRTARAAHPATRRRHGRLRAGAQAAQLAAEERPGPRTCRPTSCPTLDIWDERLVALGSEIIDQRVALVGELATPLAAGVPRRSSTPITPPSCGRRSRSTAPIPTTRASRMPRPGHDPADPDAPARRPRPADRFTEALRMLRPKELERGITLVGPHRDDVVLLLNGLPAKGYASHGESWSFALALRLASAELLRRDSTTGDPVLVLDDVFAELDRLRRRAPRRRDRRLRAGARHRGGARGRARAAHRPHRAHRRGPHRRGGGDHRCLSAATVRGGAGLPALPRDLRRQPRPRPGASSQPHTRDHRQRAVHARARPEAARRRDRRTHHAARLERLRWRSTRCSLRGPRSPARRPRSTRSRSPSRTACCRSAASRRRGRRSSA